MAVTVALHTGFERLAENRFLTVNLLSSSDASSVSHSIEVPLTRFMQHVLVKSDILLTIALLYQRSVSRHNRISILLLFCFCFVSVLLPRELCYKTRWRKKCACLVFPLDCINRLYSKSFVVESRNKP